MKNASIDRLASSSGKLALEYVRCCLILSCGLSLVRSFRRPPNYQWQDFVVETLICGVIGVVGGYLVDLATEYGQRHRS